MFLMFEWTAVFRHHVSVVIPYIASTKVSGEFFRVCHIKLGFSDVCHLNSCPADSGTQPSTRQCLAQSSAICSSRYRSKTFPAVAPLAWRCWGAWCGKWEQRNCHSPLCGRAGILHEQEGAAQLEYEESGD